MTTRDSIRHPYHHFQPGPTLVADDSGYHAFDILRTPHGTLLLATYLKGDIYILRSIDGGHSWKTTSLGRAGQATWRPRLFMVDEHIVGVSATQASLPPYDNYFRFSTDDGMSFNHPWINLSLSGDVYGHKHLGQIVWFSRDRFLAMFFHDTVYWRISDELGRWLSTERRSLPVRGFFSLQPVGDVIQVAVFDHDSLDFDLYWSEDQGQSFDLVSNIPVGKDILDNDLWFHRETDRLYVCYAIWHAPFAQSIAYRCSSDLGVTWSDENVYLEGLSVPTHSQPACHIDETGIYVAYKDAMTEEIRVMLPEGEPPTGFA